MKALIVVVDGMWNVGSVAVDFERSMGIGRLHSVQDIGLQDNGVSLMWDGEHQALGSKTSS